MRLRLLQRQPRSKHLASEKFILEKPDNAIPLQLNPFP